MTTATTTTIVTIMTQAVHVDVHGCLSLTLLWAAISRTGSGTAAPMPKLFHVSEVGSSRVSARLTHCIDMVWSPGQAAKELQELGYQLPARWGELVECFPDIQDAPNEWEALTLILNWLSVNDMRVGYDSLPWPIADAQCLPELLELCRRAGARHEFNRRAHISPLALALIGLFGSSDTSMELQVANHVQAMDEAGEPALTIVLCSHDDTRDTVCVLSANIDDQNPEFFQHCQTKLFAAGALDVLFQPVYMKKQRPATMLTVIGRPSDRDTLVDIILAETSTLGVRCTQAERIKLLRTVQKVSLPWGDVAVKLGFRSGKLTNVAPEYEDCCRLAERHQVPVKFIYQQAITAFWQTWDTGDSE